MSNAKKSVGYKHVTPQLLKLIKEVLGEGDQHNYSVSRLYAAYNGALQKSDKPQTCSSCLRNRHRELKKWYADFDKSKSGNAKAPQLTEDDEAVTYDEVINKYGLVIGDDEATERATIGTNLETGVPEFSEGERALVQARYDALSAVGPEEADAAFLEAHAARLAELGVTQDSDDADLLEALEVLSMGEGVTEQEAAYYASEIEKVSARATSHTVNTDGALRLKEEGAQGIIFTPNEGEPNKGTVTWVDGTKVKAGTYPLADGRDLAVQVGSKGTIKEEDLT